MTPNQKNLLAIIKLRKKQKLDCTVKILSSITSFSMETTYKNLYALKKLRKIKRQKIENDARYKEFNWLPMTLKEFQLPQINGITICPPRYATGYGYPQKNLQSLTIEET